MLDFRFFKVVLYRVVFLQMIYCLNKGRDNVPYKIDTMYCNNGNCDVAST